MPGSRLTTDLLAHHFDRALPVHAKGRLVDLGCGKAPLYGHYRQFVSDTTCVDWPSSGHAEANVYADILCDLNQPTPLPDGAFDTLIVSDVFEHLHSPWILWGELQRISAPNAKLLLSVPFFYPIHEAPHDHFRYTNYRLQKFCEDYGFTVISLEPIGGSLECLTDFLTKHIQFIPFVGRPIACAISALMRLFTLSSLGNSARKKTGAHFPLGYFLVAQKA